MEKRVEALLSRLKEVEIQFGEPDVLKDRKRYKALSQDHSYLLKLKAAWEHYLELTNSLAENLHLAKIETDPDFLVMVRQEITSLEASIESAHEAVTHLLVPPDPNDNANVIVELRAGTGGDEAALFVADCVRMYSYFAQNVMRWKFEMLSCSDSEVGGYKEYVFSLRGENVHRHMQYEAGVHRVQRVPATETQGRVHTSAITVAVLIEPDEEEEIVLDEKDLRIDTFRATGPGGQGVNTTDSAVRITHLPTGAVATSMQERSQVKNKAIAMRCLVARIKDELDRKKHEETSSTRAAQIGSGDRSDKIRTYNYSQNRVTDHRVPGLTVHNLDQVMKGELKNISDALVSHFHALKLKGDEA